MFTRQRKARVLFGLSDIILVTLAFEAAYRTRAILHLERLFYLTVEHKALVLGFALVAWVTIGLWLEIYEKLDSGHPADHPARHRAPVRLMARCAWWCSNTCCAWTSAASSCCLFSAIRLGSAAAVPADGGAGGGSDPPRSSPRRTT